ncbi:hypothetical protein D5086_002127 [Populus alba]|uniref:Uncharacterized protein n=1 Tax=Populus alba TaxID=43335 RepID=A0ACC4D0W0_POPAL
MPAFSKLYLFAYNSLQAFGWAVSLYAILINFFSTHSLNGAYASAGDLICLLQTVSFLEVIHGALGVVPSGVLFPFMQWGGRTHFVLVIVRQIVEVQELPSVFITFVAWSMAEVIRYSHYALNCIGSCPSWITYLRYTAFIVLYPIGLAPGEMWTMYQALPFVKKKNLYADFFAAFPFSYYNFLRMVVLPSWQNIIGRNVEWVCVMGLYWKMLYDKAYLGFSHSLTNINALDKPILPFQPGCECCASLLSFPLVKSLPVFVKATTVKIGQASRDKEEEVNARVLSLRRLVTILVVINCVWYLISDKSDRCICYLY